MFNLVEKNQKLVKGIMIAVTATFVVWGIGGYLGMSGDDGYVAKVGSSKIYTNDIDNALEQNPKNTDKMQVLFGLINRQLLLNNFDRYHMSATQEQMQQEISNMPIFQDNNAFSTKKYHDFLTQRMMSSNQFEGEVSKQILLTQELDFFKGIYFTSSLFNQQFLKLLSRQRNVSSYIIEPSQFYSKINPTDKDVAAYYQQNIAKFTLPEMAKVQYLKLSAEEIAKGITPTDDEINKYITNNQAHLASTQIDVSHILFSVPANASKEQKEAVKAKAQKILTEVRANPAKFAELAKQYSADTVSAAKGGDLGYFGKGVMVKPFENVAFSMKPGQISDLVETQYGYHILKLNNIKGVDNAAIRQEAIATLKKQRSTALIKKQLEQLNDITYSQPTTLDPAAKKLGLSILDSDWVKKGTLTGDFANPKIQQAIFNNDVTLKHNNSEVVDLGNTTYTVYRVTDYKPSKVQLLNEVKAQIIDEIKKNQGSMLAYQEGQKDINLLQSKKLDLAFNNPQNVTLLGQSRDINAMAVKQIFGTSIANLPAYTGNINESGAFVIYKINGENTDPKLITQNQPIINQLEQGSSSLDMGAYLSVLRDSDSVSYKIDRLNQQQQSPQDSQ